MKQRVAIIDGIRTPLIKAGGLFKDLTAHDLGALVTRELLARTGTPADALDEVIFGNVAQPPEAVNIARVIALKAGIPSSIIAHTVHRNCASGMQSITSAAEKILAGEASLILAGGAESMSRIPLYYPHAMSDWMVRLYKSKTLMQKLRTVLALRPALLKPVIGLELGLTDLFCGMNMGQTAEVLAREFQVTRKEQDQFALVSHQRALAAREAGVFREESIPVFLPPDYARIQMDDDGPRAGLTFENLRKLKPYFEKQTGTVTVGNACPVTDGAAAVILMAEDRARSEGLTPLGYLRAFAYAGLPGNRMGLGPVFAFSRLSQKAGFSLSDFDLIELNEAFAAQVIACERAFASEAFARRELGRKEALGVIDRDILNVNGGAIALGHPVGTTGTRLVITLLRELRRRSKNLGLATLCIGGGQGAALVLEVS